jgi:hypothetical protein
MHSKVAWLAALILSGCGTSVTMTRLQAHDVSTKLPPSSVEVFASGPPSAPHHDVALLEVEQTHGFNEQGTHLMIRKLQERASQAGCDGIVLGGFTDHDGQPYATVWRLLDPGSTTLSATCIVYREDELVLPFRDPPVARVRRTLASGDGVRQRIDREDPP